MNIHFFWFFWLNLSNCKDISMPQICQAKSLNQLNGKFPKVMLTLGHSLYHKQWIKNWKLKMDICYKKINGHKNNGIYITDSTHVTVKKWLLLMETPKYCPHYVLTEHVSSWYISVVCLKNETTKKCSRKLRAFQVFMKL